MSVSDTLTKRFHKELFEKYKFIFEKNNKGSDNMELSEKKLKSFEKKMTKIRLKSSVKYAHKRIDKILERIDKLELGPESHCAKVQTELEILTDALNLIEINYTMKTEEEYTYIFVGIDDKLSSLQKLICDCSFIEFDGNGDVASY